MSAGDWTEEEQRRLEEGLIKFASTTNVAEKFRAIAKHVGTRDVAACRDRFAYCRQLALEEQRLRNPSPVASPEASDDEEEDEEAAEIGEPTADTQRDGKGSGKGWQRSGGRWGSGSWRNWHSSWHDQKWTQGGDAWDASRSGWNSTDGWNASGSWQDAAWEYGEEAAAEKDEEPELTEEEKRALEARREVEANRERMKRREEQRQREDEQREKKRQADLEEKSKKQREYVEAQEKKYQETLDKKRQQREQALEAERRAKQEAERTDIPFFGPRPSPSPSKSSVPDKYPALPGSSAAPVGTRGWASKAAAKKSALQRQKKNEEMERKAAEALANIAGSKSSTATAAKESESSEEEPPPPVPVQAKKPSEVALAETPPEPETVPAAVPPAAPAAAPTPMREAEPEKATSSRRGPKGPSGANRQPKKRWWHKLDGDCAISLAPLCELPQPPFGLTAEDSSAVHYYDARFLASFLVSSCDFIDPANRRPLTLEECVALDEHLQWYHRDDPVSSVADAFALFQGRGHSEAAAGDDQVQREATAVLQHLFRFRSARRIDDRGRAVNYRDAGLTVVDDDDILAQAEAPADAPRQPGTNEGPDFPTLGGNSSNSSAGGPSSAAWRNRQAAGYPSTAAEAFPTLPTSKPKGPPPKAATKAANAGRGQLSSGGGRGKGGPQKQHQLRSGPKGWGAPK